jgi:7-carboxy-7-deazaguanine synthase
MLNGGVKMENKAPLVETFVSVDGEVNCCGQGALSCFIRLAGCNLSCSWCDTKWSWDKTKFIDFSSLDIYRMAVAQSPFSKVTITGGEPLIYPEFVNELVNLFYPKIVTIETNGTIPINTIFGRSLAWVLDSKPPSSKHCGLFVYKNLELLRDIDFIKIVIHTKEDLDWACYETFYLKSLGCKARIAWGCTSEGEVKPKHIIPVLQSAHLEHVILNTQLHKFLKLK